MAREKYATLNEAQRAQLIQMDQQAQIMKEKLRADVMASPELKAGILHIVKLAKLWTPTIGHKRIGQVLVELAQELL